MSERNIPVRIMVTSEEWGVFAEIAAKQRLEDVPAAIEAMLADTVTKARALSDEPDGN